MKPFRIYYKIAGNHVHTQWFHSGKNGELSFDLDEWALIEAYLSSPSAGGIFDLIDKEAMAIDLQT